MAWFPLLIDLEDKPCLVVGGGRVALHKARTLLSFGARVTVIAMAYLPEFDSLPAALHRRKVLLTDAAGMALVVDATGDRRVGEQLAEECGRLGIPINVVDRPELCGFIFPAVLRRGPLVAAVSTGGTSPTAAAWVRDRLDETLPGCLEAILEQMGALRVEAREAFDDPARRSALMKRCFLAAAEKQAPLSKEELCALWREEA